MAEKLAQAEARAAEAEEESARLREMPDGPANSGDGMDGDGTLLARAEDATAGRAVKLKSTGSLRWPYNKPR